LLTQYDIGWGKKGEKGGGKEGEKGGKEKKKAEFPYEFSYSNIYSFCSDDGEEGEGKKKKEKEGKTTRRPSSTPSFKGPFPARLVITRGGGGEKKGGEGKESGEGTTSSNYPYSATKLTNMRGGKKEKKRKKGKESPIYCFQCV